MNFLNGINSANRRWNISLFHYRNHGADTGRVLVGIQVPGGEGRRFNGFLRRLGYPINAKATIPLIGFFWPLGQTNSNA